MSDDNAQRTLAEAGAYSSALRTSGHFSATESALTELGYALEAAEFVDLVRDLAKVAELHRLAAARYAAIVRRLAEGPR